MIKDMFIRIHKIRFIRIVYLRNRKRVACVYGVIMHAGNFGRIQEKRVKHEAEPYNISWRSYVINNFTVKVNFAILLT